MIIVTDLFSRQTQLPNAKAERILLALTHLCTPECFKPCDVSLLRLYVSLNRKVVSAQCAFNENFI